MGFEPGTQCRVFRVQLGKMRTKWTDRLADFLLGETWRDVLMAVPIERFQAHAEDAFELGLVIR